MPDPGTTASLAFTVPSHQLISMNFQTISDATIRPLLDHVALEHPLRTGPVDPLSAPTDPAKQVLMPALRPPCRNRLIIEELPRQDSNLD